MKTLLQIQYFDIPGADALNRASAELCRLVGETVRDAYEPVICEFLAHRKVKAGEGGLTENYLNSLQTMNGSDLWVIEAIVATLDYRTVELDHIVWIPKALHDDRHIFMVQVGAFHRDFARIVGDFYRLVNIRKTVV